MGEFKLEALKALILFLICICIFGLILFKIIPNRRLPLATTHYCMQKTNGVKEYKECLEILTK